jgi:nitrite reductase (NADH) small subunit
MTPGETQWMPITGCENIPLREGRAVHVRGQELAIFNLGDRFLASINRCPHRGGPLADGIISGQNIVCPLHAWKFDLVSGNAVNHPESRACVATFPTRVENGLIFVQLPVESPVGETVPVQCLRRDRPLRWVQRKPLTASSEPGLDA